MGTGIYVGIFLVVIATGAGLPIPEEAPLVAAGILAHQEESRVGGAVVWPALYSVCWIGVVLGDFILYAAGWQWGTGLLARRWIRRMLPVATQERVRRRFTQHGPLVLVFARFTPGTRIPTFLMAGALGLPARTFLLADGLAAMLYVGLVFGLAYTLGDEAAATLEVLRDYQAVVAIAVSVGIVVYLVVQFRSSPVPTIVAPPEPVALTPDAGVSNPQPPRSIPNGSTGSPAEPQFVQVDVVHRGEVQGQHL